MIGITPLAGPEVFHPDHGIHPLTPIGGEPLVRRTITSRSWWRRGNLRAKDLIFVIRHAPEAATLSAHLECWLPGSHQVQVSRLTAGTLLSCLAGTSQIDDFERPLCLDLADIIYDADAAILDMLDQDSSLGAIVPCFESTDPCYSYLEIDEAGDVVRTVEK